MGGLRKPWHGIKTNHFTLGKFKNLWKLIIKRTTTTSIGMRRFAVVTARWTLAVEISLSIASGGQIESLILHKIYPSRLTDGCHFIGCITPLLTKFMQINITGCQWHPIAYYYIIIIIVSRWSTLSSYYFHYILFYYP